MTKDDWKDRIEPALSHSLREVSDRITNARPMQSWIPEATFEAADGVAQNTLDAEAQGYMRMMDGLTDRFPELVAAVDELTDGFGQLDLDWRPLTPNFTRVYVRFDWEADVKLFLRLPDRTPDSLQEALDAVADALPDSEPFPNRPNTVTGLVVHDGRGLAVRALCHRGAQEGETTVRFTLIPKDGSPLEDVERSRALQALRRVFGASE